MSRALGSSFTRAKLMMLRACLAYRSVLSVSSMWMLDGLMVASMAVLEFPPRLSFNILKHEKTHSERNSTLKQATSCEVRLHTDLAHLNLTPFSVYFKNNLKIFTTYILKWNRLA